MASLNSSARVCSSGAALLLIMSALPHSENTVRNELDSLVVNKTPALLPNYNLLADTRQRPAYCWRTMRAYMSHCVVHTWVIF